jgi:hypothetical protein
MAGILTKEFRRELRRELKPSPHPPVTFFGGPIPYPPGFLKVPPLTPPIEQLAAIALHRAGGVRAVPVQGAGRLGDGSSSWLPQP